MAKLERGPQPTVKEEGKKAKLDRGPWWEQKKYSNYPIKIYSWEDEGGVTRESFCVACPRYGRIMAVELCIKGMFYFDPKNKDCKRCWKLPPGVDYPPVFKNTPKENKVPEALKVLTETQRNRARVKEEVLADFDFTCACGNNIKGRRPLKSTIKCENCSAEFVLEEAVEGEQENGQKE